MLCETGTDESAQVLTQKNRKSLTLRQPGAEFLALVLQSSMLTNQPQTSVSLGHLMLTEVLYGVM